MLYTILQIIAFQALFLLVYDLFLKRETFFNYNRVYLLVTSILSLVLPFIKLPMLKTMTVKDAVIHLPEVFIGVKPPTEYEILVAEQAGIIIDKPEIPVWQTIVWAGIVVASLFFLFKITKLILLKLKNPKRWHGDVLIVNLIKSTAAFSFFNTIFLGEKIPNSERATIFKHELVHIKEMHTLDLLFFEILKIAMWFNPLVYLYQSRIKELHEFIADAKSVKQQGKSEYYQNLLNQVFEGHNVSFINTFFKKSLIKKRIAMLQKSKSKQLNLVKYALLIPLVLGMLIYTSTEVRAYQKTESNNDVNQELTEKQLIKKYYDQMVEMEKNGKTFFEIAEFAGIGEDKLYKYTQSKEEFLKFKAYLEYISDKNLNRKAKVGSLTKEEIKKYKSLKEAGHKTYAEYRAWLKTDEAKRRWENITVDKSLRLFVEDILHKTDIEEKKYNKLLKKLENDDSVEKVIVTDGQSTLILDDYSSNPEKVIKIEEFVEVPFSVIEEVPTLPECKDLPNNEERKKCMSQFVAKHVNKNFNINLADSLNLTGRQRIFVSFKIGTDGFIKDTKARAAHSDLEDEAVRVIKILPQFSPGKQKGKEVTVPYSLPIVFQINNGNKEQLNNMYNKLVAQRNRLLQNSSDKNPVILNLNKQIDSISKLQFKREKEYLKLIEQREKRIIKNDSTVPFSIIDEVPFLPECKGLQNNEERKKCTSQKVAMHVNSNFNIKIADSLGLSGGRKRIFVKFTIDKKGGLIDVGARAAHPALETEAIRVVKSLPQFIPGKHKEELVKVPYSLPIVFQIADKPKKSKN